MKQFYKEEFKKDKERMYLYAEKSVSYVIKFYL